MNFNKNELLAALGAALVVLVIGVGIGRWATSGTLFGSTLTYTASVSQLETYNLLNGIATDLVNVRAPLAGMKSTSTTIAVNSLVSPNFEATGTVTGLGSSVVLGDLCLATLATGTPSNGSVTTGCQITSTGTAQWFVVNATNTAWSVGSTSPISVRALPLASFAAPAALGTATTTTP